MAAPVRIDLETLRAVWMHLQGLTDASGGAAWLHAIGGADVYLAARARSEDLARSDLDGAVAADQRRVVPAARGCIMLVPRAEVAAALALGGSIYRKRTSREMDKLGVPRRELDRLRDNVLEALSDGPRDGAELRTVVPKRAVRSLGDAGKKLGHATTLPVVLRYLEAEGRVRRCPPGGKLDGDGYQWMLDDTDLARGLVDEGAVAGEALATAVGRSYFAHHGPATRKDFATWAGITQRDARAAMAALEVIELTVDGLDEPYWALPGQVDAVRKPPAAPAVALIPFRDPLLDARVTPRPLLHERHLGLEVDGWGSGKKTLRDVKAMHNRCILLDGAIAGLWDFDESAGEVIWATFDPIKGKQKKAVIAQCRSAGAFLRNEIGHARIYAMESARSRAGRLTAVGDLRRA